MRSYPQPVATHGNGFLMVSRGYPHIPPHPPYTTQHVGPTVGCLAWRRSQSSVSSDTRSDRPDHQRQDAREEAEAEQTVLAQARENRSERDEKPNPADERHDACPACEDSASECQETGGQEECSEAHRREQERPCRGTRDRTSHDRIGVSTLGRRARDYDDRHDHARDPRDGTGKRDPSKLHRTASPWFRVTERSSDGRREVQKHESCKQHRESTDAALPLVVARPACPVLVRRPVVRSVPTTGEPPDEKENREGYARQRQEPLPRER